MTPLRQRMLEDMAVRNFSPKTQQTYIDHVAKFARYFGKSPDVLGPEQIRTSQVYLVQEKQVAWSTFNQAVCALRFFYQTSIGKDLAVKHIPYPRKERKLPVVL